MKYISEERLAEIRDSARAGQSKLFVHLLITQCKELNPWQPIETSPKDRRILLLYEDGDIRIDWWHHESQQDNKIVAWTELPETPK